jgi:hypothetical protein
MPRSGSVQALILRCILLSKQLNRIFLDLLEGVWGRECRVRCARFGLWVFEWSMKVHAIATGDVLGTQAVKTQMMQG